MWLAAVLAVASVAVLRVSWARSGRSRLLNLIGWAALMFACVLGWMAFGAWGTTIAGLAATGAAIFALAIAAFEQPKLKRRSSETARSNDTIAASRSALSGWITFCIAGPLALIASVILSLAARSMVLAAGGAEANANVTVLALVPLVWALLVFVLLMLDERRTQVAIVAATTALIIPLVIAEGIFV